MVGLVQSLNCREGPDYWNFTCIVETINVVMHRLILHPFDLASKCFNHPIDSPLVFVKERQPISR